MDTKTAEGRNEVDAGMTGDVYSLMFCKGHSDDLKKELGLIDLMAMSPEAIRERARMLRGEMQECLDRNTTLSGYLNLDLNGDEFENDEEEDDLNDVVVSTCEEGLSEMLAECCEFVTEIQTLVHEIEECQKALNG